MTDNKLDEGIISDIGKSAVLAASLAATPNYNTEKQDTSKLEAIRSHPYYETATDTTNRLARIAMEKFKHLKPDMAHQYASLAVKHSHPEFPTAEDLMASMAQESTFSHTALSGRGAYGLMQVIPKYWKIKYSDLNTPDKQVMHGSYAMRDYYKKYKGDSDIAIQAYNMGPENIRKNNLNAEYLEKHQMYKKDFSEKPEGVKYDASKQ